MADSFYKYFVLTKKLKVIINCKNSTFMRNYSNLIDDAIIFLKSKLDVPYDDLFLLNNDSYYCSELIYEAFKKDEIFDVFPMTFLHPKDNDTLENLERILQEIRK